uniref:Uncharacterized protein n=1 Tax=Ditylum brightwellii TaxID=49249 RepID=A0A6U3UKE2_9STRA|mmetsp:Transcript_342/g.409  ORF Transcript_342/g.409 Transcript_342/m.409 type:complete len:416 (+) Transcript_342:107-1354(+)
MSAAAARRRKQLAKKAAEEAANAGTTDPVILRLNTLLNSENATDESVAYEALQLAQSQVRRLVKTGEFVEAANLAYQTSRTLLEKAGRVSVSSQLLMLLVEVLNETHTVCNESWTDRLGNLDKAYRDALERDTTMEKDERVRLGRLHVQFLRKALKWSTDLGTVRFGALKLHELLGRQCWRMSFQLNSDAASATTDEDEMEEDMEYDDADVESYHGLRCYAVTHLSLAELPAVVAECLASLPAPTAEEIAMNHACPPAERDALLTRSILVFVAMENLRDANKLLTTYASTIETRDTAELTKSYMNKQDGIAPAHVVFCAMLLRVCEKDAKTGPLYSWMLRSFTGELGRMYKPDLVKSYTTKIGRVYFDIQPPPSMMNMMENMMSMMGGGGMGGGAGGMNPAMMQAAMNAMAGGGM